VVRPRSAKPLFAGSIPAPALFLEECRTEVIVTFNLRDFPGEALKQWDIVAMHPQDQLLSLCCLSPEIGLYRDRDIEGAII
jgi:hypothetical protein